MKTTVSSVVRVVAALFVLVLAVPLPARADKQEAKMGEQVYKWLASKGIILEQSPLYDILNPIAMPLKAVADPLYDAPFIFTIGRDAVANVASVPGGRVYVSDKTFDVIRYREELAGALCHAVAHTVHHDYANLVRKNMVAGLGGVTLWALVLSGNPMVMFSPLWGDTSTIVNMNTAANAVAAAGALAAARSAELSADVMGADLCAQAGLNPWGMVWLLENYRKSKNGGKMEMLADFPADRIRNLEAHFAGAPARFAKFDRDRAHATPLRP